MSALPRARETNEARARREQKERLAEVARRVRDNARREASRIVREGEVPAGGE